MSDRLKRIYACGFLSVWGQADNPQARGCNSLIKQGAKLTESFDDVLEEFDFLPGFEHKNIAKGETQEETSEDAPALGEQVMLSST